MHAVKILADGTIKACFYILRDRGISLDAVDNAALAANLKATLKANLDEIMAEWTDATEAHMSESWLRQLMNAQANEMALKTLKAMGY